MGASQERRQTGQPGQLALKSVLALAVETRWEQPALPWAQLLTSWVRRRPR